MSRDPAQRLINWFGFLMVAVFLASARPDLLDDLACVPAGARADRG